MQNRTRKDGLPFRSIAYRQQCSGIQLGNPCGDIKCQKNVFTKNPPPSLTVLQLSLEGGGWKMRQKFGRFHLFSWFIGTWVWEVWLGVFVHFQIKMLVDYGDSDEENIAAEAAAGPEERKGEAQTSNKSGNVEAKTSLVGLENKKENEAAVKKVDTKKVRTFVIPIGKDIIRESVSERREKMILGKKFDEEEGKDKCVAIGPQKKTFASFLPPPKLSNPSSNKSLFAPRSISTPSKSSSADVVETIDTPPPREVIGGVESNAESFEEEEKVCNEKADAKTVCPTPSLPILDSLLPERGVAEDMWYPEVEDIYPAEPQSLASVAPPDKGV